MRYWRILVCALALGIGALSIWADDCLRTGSPANKSRKSGPSADAAPSTPAPASPPVVPTSAPPSFEVPVIEPPARVLELSAPPTPPILPAVHEPALDKPPVIQTPEPPPAIPAAPTFKPAAPPTVELPPPPPVFTPKPEPIAPPTAVIPPPAPITPTITAQPVSSKTMAASGYKVLLRMGGSTSPRFEIRDGDLLVLKVYCDKIELHGMQDSVTNLPGLTASGKVRVHGAGLDGTCDQLTVTSATGEVTMKGHVKMTCFRGTSSSQVAADSMSFTLSKTAEHVRLKSSGTVIPASMTGNK